MSDEDIRALFEGSEESKPQPKGTKGNAHAKRIADKYIAPDGGAPNKEDPPGPDADDIDDDDHDEGDDGGQPTKQADVLIDLAQSARLFHAPAPDNDAFADIMINGHRETHRVRGQGFRQWLRHQYFKKSNSGCNADALQVATETLAAKAQFEGEERKIHVRVAEHGGAIYIDIGDPAWKAIEVTSAGWKIIDEPPVRFVRTRSTRPLPIPQRGGNIKSLKPFCNLKTDEEFVRLVAHILAVMRPDANYPPLVMTGEHGSCKSTMFRLIVRLTDPRSPEQRSLPDREDNLITAAKGAHVLPYDNISGMPDWLSDAFCRLSTGGGASKRKLYTDDDEILFDGRRPVFLNGIEDVVTRPDLVDRANIFLRPRNEEIRQPTASRSRRRSKRAAQARDAADTASNHAHAASSTRLQRRLPWAR